MIPGKTMKTTTKKTKHPVPFYRRRWVWGVVLVFTTIWGFKALLDLNNYSIQNSINYSGLKYFLLGFPGGIAMFLSLASKTSYNVFVAIYYLIIALLLFLSYRRKSVKIKYPIIILIIMLITIFGLWVATGYQGY